MNFRIFIRNWEQNKVRISPQNTNWPDPIMCSLLVLSHNVTPIEKLPTSLHLSISLSAWRLFLYLDLKYYLFFSCFVFKLFVCHKTWLWIFNVKGLFNVMNALFWHCFLSNFPNYSKGCWEWNISLSSFQMDLQRIVRFLEEEELKTDKQLEDLEREQTERDAWLEEKKQQINKLLKRD